MLHMSPLRTAIVLLICFFGILVALPNALPPDVREQMPSFLPRNTVTLGLDLQGGSSLLLEVDIAGVMKERLENKRDEIRTALRKEKINYSGGLPISGDTITIRLVDQSQADAARAAIEAAVGNAAAGLLSGASADSMATQYENGVFSVAFTEAAKTYIRNETVDHSIEVVRKRVDELGTREPTIVRQGDDRILVQVPGLQDPERLIEILGKTAKLTFRLVDTTVSPQEALLGRLPPGTELLYEDPEVPGAQPTPWVVQTRIIVSGENLKTATQGFSQSGEATVDFTFDTSGARRFGDVTTENVGRPFAIVLDNKVLSAPVIREPILGGSGQISGNFTVQSANDLALLLRAGALPAKLTTIEQRTVGPELGSDSIESGGLATAIGLALVVVWMLATYGVFGIFANIALTLNLVLTFAVMTLLGSTLTLPGIAGLVLSIGMAVDANVLIYERMREEAATGKSIIAAVDAGFSRAMSAIIDANLTSLLAVIILFQFGGGPVRGFAVTLGIGILMSMFTAITVTRLMVIFWMRRFRPKALPI